MTETTLSSQVILTTPLIGDLKAKTLRFSLCANTIRSRITVETEFLPFRY